MIGKDVAAGAPEAALYVVLCSEWPWAGVFDTDSIGMAAVQRRLSERGSLQQSSHVCMHSHTSNTLVCAFTRESTRPQHPPSRPVAIWVGIWDGVGQGALYADASLLPPQYTHVSNVLQA